MRSSSANAQVAATLDSPRVGARRSVDYGGLVGEMLTELESRMTHGQAVAAQPAGVDLVHGFSVAAGYVGLAAGFVMTGAGILWLVA